MQRRLLTCFFVTFAVVNTFAAVTIPVLRVGNDYYTNAVVTTATATDIFFSHSRGMGNAKLKYLDPEVQKRFSFDSSKAQEAEKKQTDANLAFRKESAGKPAVRRDTYTREPTSEAVVAGDIPVPEIHAISYRGRPAPRMIVEKWLTAQPEMRGKFVLIDFWATWCGPCRKSIPDLNKLHAKFGDKLVIIGLSDEEEKDVQAMMSPKIDYAVGIDRTANMKTALGVRGIPHALILDPNGVVRFEGHPGYLNERNVAGLLAKYSP